MNALTAPANTLRLGTAEWGDPDGQVLTGHFDGEFVVGYQENGAPIGLKDDRHVLIVGGTRGGKGVSTLIPNLITYPGSVVVIDPKGENAMVTARRRGRGNQFAQGMGQKVQILDPMGEVATPFDDFSDLRAAFNPLSVLHASRPESVDDAARIAEALIHGEGQSDPYWNNAAKDLLVGLILHVATSNDIAEGDRNLGTVFDMLLAGQDDGFASALMKSRRSVSPMEMLFMAMKRNRAFGGLVARYGTSFLTLATTSERQFHGVAGIALASMNFLRSERMRACVSHSTFALHELKTAPEGLSLYVCLPQRDLETHYPWLRMIVSLITAEMERIKEAPATGHPVWMILDEFPALKRMRSIENAAAQIAGFGVKLIFVAQTLAQLKDLYKDNWETFVANCGAKLFFCNEDHFTCNYVSRLIGEHEVIRTSVSKSYTQGESKTASRSNSLSFTSGSSRQDSSGGQTSWSESDSVTRSFSRSESEGQSKSATHGITESIHKRALLTPDEVKRHFGNPHDPRVLVLLSGFQPMALTRNLYFKQHCFEGYFDVHPKHALPPTYAEAVRLREQRAREREELAQKQRKQEETERWLREQRAMREAEEAAAAKAESDKHRRLHTEKMQMRRFMFYTIFGVSLTAAMSLYPLQTIAVVIATPILYAWFSR